MQHESTFFTRNRVLTTLYPLHHAAVSSQPSCGKPLFGGYDSAMNLRHPLQLKVGAGDFKKLANVTTLLSIAPIKGWHELSIPLEGRVIKYIYLVC